MTIDQTGRGILEAICALESAIASQSGDELDRIAALARALDGLVHQYNIAPDTEPDQGEDAPLVEHGVFLDPINAAFPSFGFYADVDPSDDLNQGIGAGLAYDDLADIATDLADVRWYFDQGRPETAIWDFRFGYQSHWGRHLHDLRRYLYHRLN